ncbi:TetR/AcrR family transcriptional regulator [Sporolactobacillus putidus]|uniref:TetR family transcriptional regulator n=1 Tax=Sporolactobacillus putidus TaxID=492735 RepID=A0A917VZM2_9BACL|nr:TetR/AcrR family transcriptional regulator [Sporolactobacillus putidus]GGL48624.1 TetR family transcriptional regulator [Sporolactobacillus putidus]
MTEQKSTQERIIEAFIELFRDYGYKGTTTRAIAERAGVNEVTVFRHFGNKRAIMDAAIQSVSYSPRLEKLIQEKVTWDLEKDLRMIASGYLGYMENTRDLLMIGFREAGNFPELNKMIVKIPLELKRVLVRYFSEMRQKGKIIDADIDYQAMNFLLLNFGYFLSKSRFADQVIPDSLDDFLNSSIQLFVRGLTP